VTIAEMYRFSCRPSEVLLPWSLLKSLGLGLETQSLGLDLDKKILFTSLIECEMT